MRRIDSTLAAAVAIAVWGVTSSAAAQSLASAATTTARTPSQVASTTPVPLTIDAAIAIGSKTSSSAAANPSKPAAPVKTAAISIKAPVTPAASPSAAAAICSTPADAPTAAASTPGSVRPVALIVPTKHADETAAGQKAFYQAADDEQSNPMNWSLHVFKGRHRTELYFKGYLFKVYHAVFGRSRWTGAKLMEGDTRTPEGSYLITEKRRSSRFDWFLKLNYPNGADQERFAALKASHEISAGAREGGQVGIHGTDSPALNVRDVNWTLGCISVDNPDIEEMARLLPVGTLVVINP